MELLTFEQTATELGIAPSTMNNLVKDLKLSPASGHNPKTWMFTLEAIERRKRAVVESKRRQRPGPPFGTRRSAA